MEFFYHYNFFKQLFVASANRFFFTRTVINNSQLLTWAVLKGWILYLNLVPFITSWIRILRSVLLMAIAYGSETLAESLVRYIGISGFSWWIVNSGLRLQYLEGELDAPEAAGSKGGRLRSFLHWSYYYYHYQYLVP